MNELASFIHGTIMFGVINILVIGLIATVSSIFLYITKDR